MALQRIAVGKRFIYILETFEKKTFWQLSHCRCFSGARIDTARAHWAGATKPDDLQCRAKSLALLEVRNSLRNSSNDASCVAWLTWLDFQIDKLKHWFPIRLQACSWFLRVKLHFERRELTLWSVRYNLRNWDIGEVRIAKPLMRYAALFVLFLLASCSKHHSDALRIEIFVAGFILLKCSTFSSERHLFHQVVFVPHVNNID